VHSGITTRSDPDGLFTLEVPAADRKDKSPGAATETLLFSKPGYNSFEYRQLVLNPGLNQLEIMMSKGVGTLVRKNRSRGNRGDTVQDEFFEFSSTPLAIPESHAGEITSLEIVPSTSNGGWILIKRGAKAILKARNLSGVE